MSASSGRRRAKIPRELQIIEDAMREGVIEALRIHKRMGVPIVVWKNGRIVRIPANKIRIPRLPRKARKARPKRA